MNDWTSKWASSCENSTYHICEQWRLRRACASGQSRQSLRCSLTQYRELKETSDKELEIWTHWIAVHANLKERKPHNAKVLYLMSRLKWLKSGYKAYTRVVRELLRQSPFCQNDWSSFTTTTWPSSATYIWSWAELSHCCLWWLWSSSLMKAYTPTTSEHVT